MSDDYLPADVGRLTSELATYKRALVDAVQANASMRGAVYKRLGLPLSFTPQQLDEALAGLVRERDEAWADAAANEASLDHVTSRLAELLNLDEVPLDDMLHAVAHLADQQDEAATKQSGLDCGCGHPENPFINDISWMCDGHRRKAEEGRRLLGWSGGAE